jgi:predicted nucleotidyltransferase
MVDASLLNTITRTIVERFHPRRIVLFGSFARGDAGPDSDVDLFIEMESTQRPPERTMEISGAFGLRPWPLDVVVYAPDEVRHLRGVRGTLLATVEQEGKTLYEQL